MKKGEKQRKEEKKVDQKREKVVVQKKSERERPWKRGEFGEEAEGVHVLWQETC